jgi:hypothetical protein
VKGVDIKTCQPAVRRRVLLIIAAVKGGTHPREFGAHGLHGTDGEVLSVRVNRRYRLLFRAEGLVLIGLLHHGDADRAADRAQKHEVRIRCALAAPSSPTGKKP